MAESNRNRQCMASLEARDVSSEVRGDGASTSEQTGCLNDRPTIPLPLLPCVGRTLVLVVARRLRMHSATGSVDMMPLMQKYPPLGPDCA